MIPQLHFSVSLAQRMRNASPCCSEIADYGGSGGSLVNSNWVGDSSVTPKMNR